MLDGRCSIPDTDNPRATGSSPWLLLNPGSFFSLLVPAAELFLGDCALAGESRAEFIQRVRDALTEAGEGYHPFSHAPRDVDPEVRRFVGPEAGLVDRFTEGATSAGMRVHRASNVAQATTQVVQLLQEAEIKELLVGDSGLVGQSDMASALRTEGILIERWSQLESPSKKAFDFSAALTGVDYALAETGSLVIWPSVAQGRLVSLAPALHIAVVSKDQILPDLIDLAQRLGAGGMPPQLNIITGPSKTADIELNLVKGVHGPGAVEIILVDAAG